MSLIDSFTSGIITERSIVREENLPSSRPVYWHWEESFVFDSTSCVAEVRGIYEFCTWSLRSLRHSSFDSNKISSFEIFEMAFRCKLKNSWDVIVDGDEFLMKHLLVCVSCFLCAI